MAVAEYMAQTWPSAHKPLQKLMDTVLLRPSARQYDCACRTKPCLKTITCMLTATT